ncbi:choline-binding transcriptional repressor BetI [Amaricoccus solimangrovi]|uniref:HTH-type transcriptional regulator BetI n=1 Tax=Amaricoccus solimangrovi TaxID=2589815 RepID=A0A501WTZ7_9RHOB|nr:transcriptional regulator BetI [Amaricoccus solimangrovi]TPE50441.1 transcriptional regulator BetI [Amaricoccus solimangrovi]
MSPRIAVTEMRRRALIGAALREISDRGTLDVTVAQIASRAGVSSALAHHYFGGKEDLILATMRHLLAEFADGVRERLRQAATPRERLSAIIAGSFGEDQFHQATITAWLTFYAKALSSPGAARLLAIYQRRLHTNLRHALRGLVPAADVDRVAEAMGALIDGVYLREALRGRVVAPEAAIAIVEDYVDCHLARTIDRPEVSA